MGVVGAEPRRQAFSYEVSARESERLSLSVLYKVLLS